MEVQTTFYIERDEEEIELHIFGDAEPEVPANFNGHPDNWTPPEGGGCSVEGIFLDEDGDKSWDGELTKTEKSQAESALMGALEDAIRSAAEDAAQDRAESMADDAYYDDYDDGRYGKYGPDIYDF